MVSVTDTAIDVHDVLMNIVSPKTGGIDIFIGTVRNHSGSRHVRQLEYAAYVPMAVKMMELIEEEIRRRWSVHNVVLVHRVGLLAIGDVAVVTAVGAAHRSEAFDACRYAIERIKADVPIWKKEFFEEGAAWVGSDHGVEI